MVLLWQLMADPQWSHAKGWCGVHSDSSDAGARDFYVFLCQGRQRDMPVICMRDPSDGIAIECSLVVHRRRAGVEYTLTVVTREAGVHVLGSAGTRWRPSSEQSASAYQPVDVS